MRRDPPRLALLREAVRTVEARGARYGPPQEHFARTVGAINAILARKLREPLVPADWAAMMVIDKLAREQEVPHRDNALDAAGYAACMHECRASGSA